MSSEQPGGPVLVVGGGFIGSHIAGHLIAAGENVRVLTRSEPEPEHGEFMAGAQLTIADASDRGAVEMAMQDVCWVVFGAGGLVPSASQQDPLHDAIFALQPLLTVLEVIAQQPGTAFTYLSSGGTVYGQPRTSLIREDHPTDPISSYGVLKLAGEKYTAMYGRQTGMPFRILRCANVYGAGQRTNRGQGAVAAFLSAVAEHRRVQLYGAGLVVRDYIHVSDVASAVARLRPESEPPLPEAHIVNVGTGKGTTLADLLAAVEDVLEVPADVEMLPSRPFDVDRNVLDIHRLQRLTGIRPKSLQEGLRLTAVR